jgi:hypothetical protein
MSAAQPDLFGAPSEAPARARTSMDAGHHALTSPPRGMARTADPETSKDAAARVAVKLTDKQRTVLTAFAAHRTLTGKSLERLPVCERWAPSAARKRITELASTPLFLIVPTGRVVDGCQEYREATMAETRALRAEAGL